MAYFDFDDFRRNDNVASDDSGPVEDETSFIDNSDPVVGSTDRAAETAAPAATSLRQELLQTAISNNYNAVAPTGQTNALGRDYSKFELINGRLQLKAYPEIDIVNARYSAPLTLPTVAGRRGDGSAIRNGLGFVDWQRGRRQLFPKIVTALQTANNELGEAAAAVDSVELQYLGQTAKEA
ncbi:hypothetical protein LSAT2_001159, partial [Lamellibrachia satsuma]